MVLEFMTLSVAENIDCMIRLREAPDNHWDLAICDPPYGIERSGQKLSVNNANPKHDRKYFEDKGWDKRIPSAEYFAELQRVSVNQIIWGGNYMTEHLSPSRGWVIWDKGQDGLSMSDAELAWSSFDVPLRRKTLNRVVLLMEGTIHPTQKPVALYKWLLTNYAKPGQRILDTHLGSGSSRIAAYDLGFDFVGYELDKDYFDAQEERFANHIAQPKLFVPETVISSQDSLFGQEV